MLNHTGATHESELASAPRVAQVCMVAACWRVVQLVMPGEAVCPCLFGFRAVFLRTG